MAAAGIVSVSQLPIRQFTFWTHSVRLLGLSQLPIRQFTELDKEYEREAVSQLPIRQFTNQGDCPARFKFSQLPIRPGSPHSDDIQRKSRKSAQNLSWLMEQTAQKTAFFAQN